MVAGATTTAAIINAVSPMPVDSVAAVMASPAWAAAGSDAELEEVDIDYNSVGKSGVSHNAGNVHAGKKGAEGDTAPTFIQPYLRGEDMQMNVDAAKSKMKEALQTLGLTHTEQGKQLMMTIAKQIQELALSEQALQQQHQATPTSASLNTSREG